MKDRIGGALLHYDVRGKGPAVLFLHAFPLALEMWDETVQALAGQNQLVRFDARGFGGSAAADGPLTMERIADDGVALLDRLGISQAVVCGCSMGGYAAFAFVRRHAERLKGLVLADTRAGADSPEARSNRAVQAERILKEGATAAVELFLPRLVGETTHRQRPQVIERVAALIRAQPPRSIADALAGLAARGDSTPTLREIRVPSLVLRGDEDLLIPPADAEALQRGIAGSQLASLPQAGHLPSLETPDAFTQRLREFLTTLR